MKTKELEQYLGKIITYRDIWDNYRTGKLINIDRYFATFQEGETYKYFIKIFNIAQVQLEE